MTPTQTVAHGAEILMHLFGGNTTQGKYLVGEKLTSHLGWGLTCKTEEWWVQRLCSLTVKVWSHKFCVHMTQMKYETIILKSMIDNPSIWDICGTVFSLILLLLIFG